MKYSIDKQEKYTLLKLEEEKLDSTISPELKSEMVTIQAGGASNLILNLAVTKYADSSGLSALLTGNRAYSEGGGTFVISSVTPFVEKLLKISQLDGVLNVLPTDEEAVDLVFMNDLENDLKDEMGES